MTHDTHQTVLLQEAVDALKVRADGTYIDGTYGRGGHSQAILQQLGAQGRLLAFDKDQAACEQAQIHHAQDQRFRIINQSFAQLAAVCTEHNLSQIDGLLLDLGVSSPQLDQAARGFSFMQAGPLDMRMDLNQSGTAADWLNSAEESHLAQVFKEYGEERFARRIAHAIVQARIQQPLQTTQQLAQLIERAAPIREKHKHPATRTFQAIRIFINHELDDLQTGLCDALKILRRGARLVVISFHSLEDRIVKHFIRDQSHGPQFPKSVPVMHTASTGALRRIGKAVKPSAAEIERNPRARSAIMRIAEVNHS